MVSGYLKIVKDVTSLSFQRRCLQYVPEQDKGPWAVREIVHQFRTFPEHMTEASHPRGSEPQPPHLQRLVHLGHKEHLAWCGLLDDPEKRSNKVDLFQEPNLTTIEGTPSSGSSWNTWNSINYINCGSFCVPKTSTSAIQTQRQSFWQSHWTCEWINTLCCHRCHVHGLTWNAFRVKSTRINCTADLQLQEHCLSWAVQKKWHMTFGPLNFISRTCQLDVNMQNM